MARSTALTIRRASSGDVVALADLARETFVETFGHLYHPGDLAAFLEESHSATYYEHLLASPGAAAWVVATPAHALVGYLTAGPCKLPVPGLEARAGEVQRMYLRGSVQREGLGRRLMVTALDWLAAQDYSPLYVGVWSGNSGAQRLYGRFGFEKIGEYDFPVGRHIDREFILRQRT